MADFENFTGKTILNEDYLTWLNNEETAISNYNTADNQENIFSTAILPPNSTKLKRVKNPSHSDEFSLGGWRSLRTIENRDAIPAALRKLGMAVFVLEDQKTYTLLSGLTNEYWEEHPGCIKGKSAYDIAKSYNPNIGTEEEWLSSLKASVEVGTVSVSSDGTPRVTTSETNGVTSLNFELPRVTTENVVSLLNNMINVFNNNIFLTPIFIGEISGKELSSTVVSGWVGTNSASSIDTSFEYFVVYNGIVLKEVDDYTVEANKITFNVFDDDSLYTSSNLQVYKKMTYNFEQLQMSPETTGD